MSESRNGGSAGRSNLLINFVQARGEVEDVWRRGSGGGDWFNEDSCREGSSLLLCGSVSKPGRQMGSGID